MAKVKVTVTSSTKQAYNSAMLGARTGKVIVYLTSPGRPTNIGLQLGKACYPCSK